MKRLLVYSQGMGLGHIRRTRNIALEILAREPDVSVLAIADSPATAQFPPVPGIDYIKLPSIVRSDTDSWQPATLGMQMSDVLRLRSAIISQVFNEFAPDAVLVDHRPTGLLGELKPILETAVKQPNAPRLVLGLRDILDAPNVKRMAWNKIGAYDYLPYYDDILVYGVREIHDAEAEYGLGDHARNLTFCNYVSTPIGKAQAEDGSRHPYVLVTSGSGHDGYALTHAFVRMLPMLAQAIPFHAVLLLGPSMAQAHRDSLVAECASYDVEIIDSTRDATSLMKNATAVITMGGYNTMTELLQLQKKALVVPRVGPSAEQRMRARLFAERGLVKSLSSEMLSPKRLASSIVDLLGNDAIPNIAKIPPLDGAQRAADILMGGSSTVTARGNTMNDQESAPEAILQEALDIVRESNR